MKEDFQLVPYDLEIATIEALKAKYLDITIPPEDKAAYAMVMSGLRECRNLLKDADDWHKDKKALILKAGRHYDGEKNRVHGLIEPIQDHLKAVRKVEDDRVEAIQAEKIRLEQERVAGIRAVIEEIRACRDISPWMTSEGMKSVHQRVVEMEFNFQEFDSEAKLVTTETLEILDGLIAKRLQFEKEEADRKAEAERLEKVRKEQEAEAEKARKERETLEAERRKIEAEKAALEAEKKAELECRERAAFEAKAKEDARIKAEQEAQERFARIEREKKERAEREAKEAKEKAEAEVAEKARKAALAPDKDKILTWARELNQRLLDMRPDLESRDARIIMGNADIAIDAAVVFAVQQAKEL